MRVGILGGTGFLLPDAEPIDVDTPWGSVEVAHANDVFFVKRHGRAAAQRGADASADASSEHVAPHRIVHRANIDALARCGVDAILAVNAVGALDERLAIPSLLVPDDLLDLRKTTETFHDARAVHVDMSAPYCPTLRALLVRETNAHDGGTYVATEGPRLETPAEIRMMRALGGSVVGMTGAPEAALARERALCYASLCLVVNPAAGLQRAPLVAEDLRAGAAALMPQALDAALRSARDVRAERACRCRDALKGADLS